MRIGTSGKLKRDAFILVVLMVVYASAARFVSNSYFQLILTLVPIWAAFGVSWNILYPAMAASCLSDTRASSVLGGYSVTLALVYWDLTPWLGIPLGVIMGAVAAVIIGTPTHSALRGHYFALSMLAYPLAILYFMQYFGFTGSVAADAPGSAVGVYLEFADPRYYTIVADRPAGDQRVRLHAGRGIEEFGPGAAGAAAERTGGRGKRRASTRAPGKCAR